jgi:hypothetical protein
VGGGGDNERVTDNKSKKEYIILGHVCNDRIHVNTCVSM